jgi:hypothetical protein
LWFGDGTNSQKINIHCEANFTSDPDAKGLQDNIMLAGLKNSILQFNANYYEPVTQARNAVFTYDHEGYYGGVRDVVPGGPPQGATPYTGGLRGGILSTAHSTVEVGFTKADVQFFDRMRPAVRLIDGTTLLNMRDLSVWIGDLITNGPAYTAIGHFMNMPGQRVGRTVKGDLSQDMHYNGAGNFNSLALDGGILIGQDITSFPGANNYFASVNIGASGAQTYGHWDNQRLQLGVRGSGAHPSTAPAIIGFVPPGNTALDGGPILDHSILVASPGTLDIFGSGASNAYVRVNGTLAVTQPIVLPPGSTGAFLPLTGGLISGHLNVNGTSTTWTSTATSGSTSSFISQGSHTSASHLSGGATINLFSVGTDTLQADNVNIMQIVANTSGAAQGTRQGLAVQLFQTSATATGGGWNALATIAEGRFSNGGTGLTATAALGSVFGFNPYARVLAGATNWAQCIGGEIDISVREPTGIFRKSGLQIVVDSADVGHGVGQDSGLTFATQTGGAGVRDLVELGNGLSQFPLYAAGDTSIMRVYTGQNALTYGMRANRGLDMLEADITSWQFRGRGFAVHGSNFVSGAVQIGNGVIQPIVGGIQISSPGNVGTGTPTVAAGGSGYLSNDILYDGYGGVYRATASGGVTAVTVLRQPFVPGAAPSNPVATTTWAATNLGTGCTLNISWSAGNALQLGDASTTTTVGGPLGVTGALTLNASPTHITGAAGTFRTLRFETGGTARFSFGLDNTAEGGTADGSNFVVSSFDNGGNAVNNAFFSLNRLTGRTSTLGITQTATIAAANIGSGTGTGFLQNGSVSGSKALASYTGINQWNISSDVGALTGQFLFNTAINYNFGGAGYTGNRGGLLILMTQTGVAAGTSGAGGIEALQASVTINNTFGGTGPGVGAAGAVFAGNLSTRLTSGATNIIGSCGLEIDVEADTGATYQSATGLAVVATTAHKQAGLLKANTAITVGAQTNSNGFEIGYAVSSWGLGASGTVFLADFAADKPTFTVTRGFDLRALTATSDIFAASNFAIGPTGRVRVGTGYFDVTATGAALSADGAICTAGTLTGSVATTFASDGNSYYVDDPYGGMWIVTFPNGTSSITAITLVSAPVVKGTPPANPITLTPRGRLNVFAPGAITANLTWDTSKTTLAIQPSGGTTTFGGTHTAGNPCFHATLSATQSVTSGVATKCNFNVEAFDSDNAYDNATNYRFTPQKAGRYHVTASIAVGAGGTSGATFSASIYKNGVEYTRNQWSSPNTNSYSNTQITTAIVAMNGTTDYLEGWGVATGTTAPAFAGTISYMEANYIGA